MGNIQNALQAFMRLFDYKYIFVAGRKGKTYEIELIFEEKDFRHLAGLHYLKDIDIPRSPSELFEKIQNNQITDEYLSKSVYYEKVDENYANVKERIWGLQFIEFFLDNRNVIFQYIKNKNIYSRIKADYLIDSSLLLGEPPFPVKAYIFLRKRSKREEYCVCSFFIKPVSPYQGREIFWLYKAKVCISTQMEEIIYISKNYRKNELETEVQESVNNFREEVAAAMEEAKEASCNPDSKRYKDFAEVLKETEE